MIQNYYPERLSVHLSVVEAYFESLCRIFGKNVVIWSRYRCRSLSALAFFSSSSTSTTGRMIFRNESRPAHAESWMLSIEYILMCGKKITVVCRYHTENHIVSKEYRVSLFLFTYDQNASLIFFGVIKRSWKRKKVEETFQQSHSSRTLCDASFVMSPVDESRTIMMTTLEMCWSRWGCQEFSSSFHICWIHSWME